MLFCPAMLPCMFDYTCPGIICFYSSTTTTETTSLMNWYLPQYSGARGKQDPLPWLLL